MVSLSFYFLILYYTILTHFSCLKPLKSLYPTDLIFIYFMLYLSVVSITLGKDKLSHFFESDLLILLADVIEGP